MVKIMIHVFVALKKAKEIVYNPNYKSANGNSPLVLILNSKDI